MFITQNRPSRANQDIWKGSGDTRQLSPFISWEERSISMEHVFTARLTQTDTKAISPPLNMPPRWDDYERGRILLAFNTTHKSSTPSVKDDTGKKKLSARQFWDNPFKTPTLAKERSDSFLETFHGVSIGKNEEYIYEFENLMLPYLPFFSNCREFDSYIPIWALTESHHCGLPETSDTHPKGWWRRNFPSLPHIDDIRAVGPFDFARFYPIADWCEQKIYCDYEERLETPDITPRWFEADSGATLFSIIRDPVSYYEYTGRQKTTSSADDGGGGKYIESIKLDDTFIPVKVDRSAAAELNSECLQLCFPRTIELNIGYYQVDRSRKRIIEINLIYDNFDRDVSSSTYSLKLNWRPLDYQELIIKFAYSRGIFLLLFTLIGVFTVVVAFMYWVIVRLSTQIETPPSLNSSAIFWLMVPQALGGCLLGLIPVFLVTAAITILLKGYSVFPSLGYDDKGKDWPVFRSTLLHYMDNKIDPKKIETTRQGRTGLAFLAMAVVSMYFSSKIFVPGRESKRERYTEKKREAQAEKESIWSPILWKRSNLAYTSILMGLFLVAIVEWSYWKSFGTYIWEVIIFLKFISALASDIVDGQLGEALLSAPVMTAMGLVQGIVTLSANDFMDFLLSYIVGFGFLIVERMYISPLQSEFLEWTGDKFREVLQKGKYLIWYRVLKRPKEETLVAQSSGKEVAHTSDTVEPIIDNFGGVCCDALSVLYTPYAILLLIVFRDETEMPSLYNIKDQDMYYYLIFSIVIIPFQFATDIVLNGCLELFHGWKIVDYIMYARYRFLQRESRWKGLDDSLDECIDESVRTLDHMCFSSQFYMMMTIHCNSIIYLVLGIEMMARAKYNLFGDPATPFLIAFVVICSTLVKKILICLAMVLRIWRVRHENINWHLNVISEDEFIVPNWDEFQGASLDAYEMTKHITSDTFRYKFLSYNRSWLINQLPTLITPRTMRRSRPYLIHQFTRILNTLNTDISSDSDADEDGPRFSEVPALDATSRTMLQWWLREAQRRLKLNSIVQPFIHQARGVQCEKCLSRKKLQVETRISMNIM